MIDFAEIFAKLERARRIAEQFKQGILNWDQAYNRLVVQGCSNDEIYKLIG
jgi:hypothetical protein